MKQYLLLTAFLLYLITLTTALPDPEVTKTIVLIPSSSGSSSVFATLTGTAASQALATTASGGSAGLAQPNDGLGVPEGGVGASDDGETGNDGTDSGSYSISTGAVVGIIVGIVVLIIAIFVVWLLWFLTKKRGWDVRKSISRASRRLTGRFNDNRSRRASNRNAVRMDSPKASQSSSQSRSKDRDLEKGGMNEKVKTVRTDTSPGTKKDRRTAMIAPPANTKQPPAAAKQSTTGTRQPPGTMGSKTPESGFDAETPVAKSFREKYIRRGA